MWELRATRRVSGLSIVPSISLLGPSSVASGRFRLSTLPVLAPFPIRSWLHPEALVGGPATLLLSSAAPAGRSRSPRVADWVWV